MSKFRRKYNDRLDFKDINRQADCRTVAEKYLEPAREKGRFICPECEKDNVTATQKTWRCWSCDAQAGRSKAIGLIVAARGLTWLDAGKLLAADLGIVAGPPSGRPPSPGHKSNGGRPALDHAHNRPTAGPEPYELESWAAALADACRVAHKRLMSRADDASRQAWDYLTGPERNLTSETIQRHGLGLNLDWLKFHDPLPGADKPCWLPPGIVLPWYAGPRGIAGANVRQLCVELKDKYIMATGSRRRWAYPGLLAPWAGPVLIVEGEFDALVAGQELAGLLPVATLGGAQCKPEDTLDAINLGRFTNLLIAADSDDAGQDCRAMWLDFSPRRAASIDLPGGKDLSDSLAAGADLRAWTMKVCTGLGIDLRQLPGPIWEQPLGAIRGRLLEPQPGFVDDYAAAERAAITGAG